jgi:hypothetical protein
LGAFCELFEITTENIWGSQLIFQKFDEQFSVLADGFRWRRTEKTLKKGVNIFSGIQEHLIQNAV